MFTFIYFIDGRPAVIKQDRVGLHGKQFNMYKFRTMYKNSHEIRDELQDLNKNDEVIFKIEDDPRIIKKAQSLRKYSLDELPQFINVLKGEMSIVGPRPLFDEDTKLFDKVTCVDLMFYLVLLGFCKSMKETHLNFPHGINMT